MKSTSFIFPVLFLFGNSFLKISHVCISSMFETFRLLTLKVISSCWVGVSAENVQIEKRVERIKKGKSKDPQIKAKVCYQLLIKSLPLSSPHVAMCFFYVWK